MNAETWIVAGGSVLVALIGMWGLLVTSRASRKATKEAATATAATLLEASRIKDRETLVTQQGDALDRLWKRVEQLEEAAVEDRAQVEDLRRQINEYADRYRMAVRYVRQLHDWMAEHLPGELKPPDPPEGLAFDLADQADPPPVWPPMRR